jgi:hypothetical protein
MANISRKCYRRRQMATRTCTVSFIGPSGVRHSVEVSADSLCEAAIVGFSLLKQDGWADPIAPGTRLDIQVRHPATTHSVSLAQLRGWVEGIAVSPTRASLERNSHARGRAEPELQSCAGRGCRHTGFSIGGIHGRGDASTVRRASLARRGFRGTGRSSRPRSRRWRAQSLQSGSH